MPGTASMCSESALATVEQHVLSQDASSTKLCFVPFSWEEKPGVPKTQAKELGDEQPQKVDCTFHSSSETVCNAHLNLMEQRHLPTHPPPVLPKPPRLQCENTVIFTKPSPNDVPASLRQHQHQLQLVRKQSFDQLIYRAQYRGRTLERKYSHGSLMHQIQREYGTGSTKAKDDPFFVAVQVCRKQPIESHYHEKAALMKDYSEQGVARGHIRHGSLETQRDSKHPTIRQLFVRQLEEEQEELFLRKAERQALHQRRPLSEKKHQRGAPTFIARCLGC